MNLDSNQKPVFVSRRAEQQWNRMQGVKMYRSGVPAADIARHFDVSPRAVFMWVALFTTGGQNALVARPASGRPPKLNAEQLQRLAFLVREHMPNQLKFEFGLWTLRLIGALILREFGVTLSLPVVGKVMHALGFSPQRPLRRAWEQDSALVATWQSQTLPKLQARAKTIGAEILYADEAGIRSDYHTGTTWGPIGRTPVVRATGQRVSIQMLSAISAQGQMQFMIHEGRVDSEVFRTFLQQLMLDRKRPIILVVDGHSIHKSGLVKEYVESTKGLLELVYLPPYSPQLNPDEQVWKNVKAEVAKKVPANKFEFRTLVENALLRLQSMRCAIAGFFRHPECGFV